MQNNKTFKILSIDGGGIKGLCSLYMLKHIEKNYCNGKPIANYFDMICGTSTGSIIAMGLSTGKSVDEMIKIYEDNATTIFPQNNSLFPFNLYDKAKNFFSRITGYRYDNSGLKKLADEAFGDKKMTDAKNLICIPSFNLSTNQIEITKNPCYGMMVRDPHRYVKDVVIASSAAPTFFQPHHYKSTDELNHFHIDGGIYANNPSLIGIAEAMKHFVGTNKPYTNYKILSVGNIKSIKSEIINETKVSTFWNPFTVQYLSQIVINTNTTIVDNICECITSGTNNDYVRLQLTPDSTNGLHTISLDSSNTDDINKMKISSENYMINFASSNNQKKDVLKTFFETEKTYEQILQFVQ